MVALTTLFRWKFGAIGMRGVRRAGSLALRPWESWPVDDPPAQVLQRITDAQGGGASGDDRRFFGNVFWAAFLMRVREIKRSGAFTIRDQP